MNIHVVQNASLWAVLSSLCYPPAFSCLFETPLLDKGSVKTSLSASWVAGNFLFSGVSLWPPEFKGQRTHRKWKLRTWHSLNITSVGFLPSFLIINLEQMLYFLGIFCNQNVMSEYSFISLKKTVCSLNRLFWSGSICAHPKLKNHETTQPQVLKTPWKKDCRSQRRGEGLWLCLMDVMWPLYS